jgi:hypothetical protein
MDKRVAQRVALVIMLGVVVMSSTACGPGTGEALFNAYLGVVGPIIGLGVLLVILFGGIPKA